MINLNDLKGFYTTKEVKSILNKLTEEQKKHIAIFESYSKAGAIDQNYFVII